jgi:hypothetical protein
MADSMSRSDRTEELLRSAAAAEQATHRLALFLGRSDDDVREQPVPAMMEALSRLPTRQPLRRGQDRAIIDAVRTLARDLSVTSPLKNRILKRLSEVSRQASELHWTPETWDRDKSA